ncbi:DNA/RNA non-specific endonuclease [Allopontixanthobacter sp.]|uniref:DNA/RNA non-specific endonuclease n=1 Tax=Allopontixanthobacter sp. TaxID=2906452 RepID=UPI003A100FA9
MHRPTSEAFQARHETAHGGGAWQLSILSPEFFIPPGWSGNGTLFNEARGHLLGRQLGGSGDLAENLVTLQQNPANSPFMRGFENQVRGAVEGGQTVRYSSTPIYNGSNLVPRGVTLSGRGSGGFDLNVTILNPPGR